MHCYSQAAMERSATPTTLGAGGMSRVCHMQAASTQRLYLARQIPKDFELTFCSLHHMILMLGWAQATAVLNSAVTSEMLTVLKRLVGL
jgi:hypothetical protein